MRVSGNSIADTVFGLLSLISLVSCSKKEGDAYEYRFALLKKHVVENWPCNLIGEGGRARNRIANNALTATCVRDLYIEELERTVSDGNLTKEELKSKVPTLNVEIVHIRNRVLALIARKEVTDGMSSRECESEYDEWFIEAAHRILAITEYCFGLFDTDLNLFENDDRYEPIVNMVYTHSNLFIRGITSFLLSDLENAAFCTELIFTTPEDRREERKQHMAEFDRLMSHFSRKYNAFCARREEMPNELSTFCM